jgi:hypothetical protein
MFQSHAGVSRYQHKINPKTVEPIFFQHTWEYEFGLLENIIFEYVEKCLEASKEVSLIINEKNFDPDIYQHLQKIASNNHCLQIIKYSPNVL